MALRFSGRCSSTCVTDSAGWLTARAVYGEGGPPEEDMALTTAGPSQLLGSERGGGGGAQRGFRTTEQELILRDGGS